MNLHRSSRRVALIIAAALGVLAAYAPAAFASGTPIVNVESAGNFHLNTTKLTATINPNGATTEYKVEYGKTKLYGFTSPTVKNLTGTTPIPISVPLAGLEEASTYHYRIVASNSFGTTTTEDHSFEMLLTWKVGGKPLSTIEGPVNYETSGAQSAWLTAEGLLGSTEIRITCDHNSPLSGSLGAGPGTITFPSCRLYANGVETKNCHSAENKAVVPINGRFALTGEINVYLGPKCAWAEEFNFLGGGFGLEPTVNERVSIEPNGYASGSYLWGESKLGWSVFLDMGQIKLTGAHAGQEFGIG
jgi:hypothetical protein